MNCSYIPESRQIPTSLVPDDSDYDAFCRLADIKDGIKEFVDNGRSLYIASKTTGNGKTTWAIKIMLKYFDSIWPGNGFRCRGVFVHIPTFLLKCKDFRNHDEEFDAYLSDIENADLVIWDDIASTDMSAYDFSQLLMYIDKRLLYGKSNIYTGNADSMDALEKRVGVKLASRVYSSNTDIVVLKGGDRR